MKNYDELLTLVSEQTKAMPSMTSRAASRRFNCLQWLLDVAGKTPDAARYRTAQAAKQRKEANRIIIAALTRE